MTAKKQIIDFILKHGYVENHWAIDNRITTRLGAVIHTLRKSGWDFIGEPIGEHKNYRYTLTRAPAKEEKLQVEVEQGQYVLPI